MTQEPTKDERARILGQGDPNTISMSPNALALPGVREALVRGFFGKVVALREGYNDGTVEPASIAGEIDAAATALQDVFYGRDRAYPPITTWNDPDHLGAWLIANAGVHPAEGNDQAVRVLLMGMAADLMQGMAKHENGEWTDSDIETKADGVIEDTMNALAGIPADEG